MDMVIHFDITWVLSCLDGRDLRWLTFLLLAQVTTASCLCILTSVYWFACNSSCYSSASNFFPGPCCTIVADFSHLYEYQTANVTYWVLERPPNLASVDVAASGVIPVFVFMAVLRYLKVPEVTRFWVVPALSEEGP